MKDNLILTIINAVGADVDQLTSCPGDRRHKDGDMLPVQQVPPLLLDLKEQPELTVWHQCRRWGCQKNAKHSVILPSRL